MAMQHMRQALGRDLHRHFSLAPARSHTITASSKASATAATRNPPPHPDPYKTGPKLAKRRRGHHTCHSTLSLPPSPPPPPAPPLAPPHLKPRMGTDGEGRRNSARLCATVVRRSGKQRSNRNRNRHTRASGRARSARRPCQAAPTELPTHPPRPARRQFVCPRPLGWHAAHLPPVVGCLTAVACRHLRRCVATAAALRRFLSLSVWLSAVVASCRHSVHRRSSATAGA